MALARLNLISLHESVLSLIWFVHSGDEFQSHLTAKGVHYFLLGFTGDLLDRLPPGPQQERLKPMKKLTFYSHVKSSVSSNLTQR